MGKSLVTKALELIGKNWSKASLTREAILQNTKDFVRFLDNKFGMENLQNLKPGHIEEYVRNLKEQNLSAGTIANRLSAVRGLAKAAGKANVAHRTNSEYGIKRTRMNPIHANTEKIAEIRTVLERMAATGDRIAMMANAAAALRDAFGLRAKESIMSSTIAGRGGKLLLQVEGAKCGRPRALEVRTDAQLKAVQLAAEVSRALGSGTGRIIPPELTLKQAINAQRTLWRTLGGTRDSKAHMHAQRHERLQKMKSEGASDAAIMKEAGHGDDRSPGCYIPK